MNILEFGEKVDSAIQNASKQQKQQTQSAKQSKNKQKQKQQHSHSSEQQEQTEDGLLGVLDPAKAPVAGAVKHHAADFF